MSVFRRPFVSGVAVACTAFAVACGDPGATTDDDGIPTILIGVGALPDRPGYDHVVHGATLAVARLEAEAAGRMRFALRLPDDTASSAVALAMAFRDDPAVLAVVGHPESGATQAAVPVYADLAGDGRRALPVVSPTATSPALSGISPWFFRVAPSDADGARDVAAHVRDSLDGETAAVIYRNDAYGRDWARAFEGAFADRGGRVLLADPYLHGETDWALYAAHVALRAPDVVLFPGDAEDAATFVRALRAAGSTARFIGGDGTAALGEQPREFAGVRYVAYYRADSASGGEEARRFLAAWHARVGTPADMFGALGYDATLAIGRAALAAPRATRAALREALPSVRFDGAAGPLAFDAATHDVRGRVVTLVEVRADSPTVTAAR